MATIYCTGPVDIWVGVGSDPPDYSSNRVPDRTSWQTPRRRKPQLLGHTESGPTIQLVDRWKDLASDEHGGQGGTPDDVAWLGEEALIYCDVNRFNELIYAKIASRPVFYQKRGLTAPRDVGTLMVRAKLTYKLWLRFPYSSKPQIGGQGIFPQQTNDAIPLPDGYRFFFAWLVGPDKLAPLGSRARKVQLTFRAIRHRAIANRTDQDSRSSDSVTVTDLPPQRFVRGRGVVKTFIGTGPTVPIFPIIPGQQPGTFGTGPTVPNKPNSFIGPGPTDPTGSGGFQNLPPITVSPSPNPSSQPGGVGQGIGGTRKNDMAPLYDHDMSELPRTYRL